MQRPRKLKEIINHGKPLEAYYKITKKNLIRNLSHGAFSISRRNQTEEQKNKASVSTKTKAPSVPQRNHPAVFGQVFILVSSPMLSHHLFFKINSCFLLPYEPGTDSGSKKKMVFLCQRRVPVFGGPCLMSPAFWSKRTTGHNQLTQTKSIPHKN